APRFDRRPHRFALHVPEHCRLNSAVRKIETGRVFFRLTPILAVAVLNLRGRELHGSRITVDREPVNDRPTGITEPQQLGYFVECLAGGIVTGMTDVLVRPTLALVPGKVKMSVPTRHHQR